MNQDTIYKVIALSAMMTDALSRGNIELAQFIRSDLQAVVVDLGLPMSLEPAAKFAASAADAYAQGRSPDWMESHLLGAITKANAAEGSPLPEGLLEVIGELLKLKAEITSGRKNPA